MVDPELRLRGLANVRVVGASVLPTMTTVNPMGGKPHETPEIDPSEV